MKLISQYERIGYIESNGSSYIDTGIYGSDLLDIEISISITFKNSLFVLASRLSSRELTYALIGDKNYSHIRFDYNKTLNVLGYYIDKITIRKSGLNVYINDVWKLNVDKGKYFFLFEPAMAERRAA